MTNVTLSRPKEKVNKSYAYPLFINGEHLMDLHNDTVETFSIEDDLITVKAKMGWAGSTIKEYHLEEREQLTLQVTGNTFYNRIVQYTGGIAFPLLAAIWVITKHISFFNYGIPTLGFLLLLYLVFTLTLDKDNWILVKEVNAVDH